MEVLALTSGMHSLFGKRETITVKLFGISCVACAVASYNDTVGMEEFGSLGCFSNGNVRCDGMGSGKGKQ